MKVSVDLIRLIGGGRSQSPSAGRKPRIEEGSKVEANYKGKGKWYPGKVKSVRLDGTFDISYDDGESETRVESVNVRLLGGGDKGFGRSPRRAAPRMEVGSK